jgi:hypothetical protein
MSTALVSPSRIARLGVLALGPAVSLGLLGLVSPTLAGSGGAYLMLALLWSPLFFSVPALLMQNERDEALANLTGVTGSALRGLLLVPWMLLRSNVRVEMAVSLCSWVLLLAFTWPVLMASVSSLVG